MSEPFEDPDTSASTVERDIHEEAYNFEPCWNDKPLEGFTTARQALAAQLNSHTPGIGANATEEAYMPGAWSVLWLCTHTPDQWRHLRNQPALWWEEIEAWAETHCPRDKWTEALDLVYGHKERQVMGMWEAARTNQVLIRTRPGPGMVGNEPSLSAKATTSLR